MKALQFVYSGVYIFLFSDHYLKKYLKKCKLYCIYLHI